MASLTEEQRAEHSLLEEHNHRRRIDLEPTAGGAALLALCENRAPQPELKYVLPLRVKRPPEDRHQTQRTWPRLLRVYESHTLSVHETVCEGKGEATWKCSPDREAVN